MSDRLTQLQVCLDQLVEQFNATVNYVNNHSDPAPLDDDATSVANIAANAPVPGQQAQPVSGTQTEAQLPNAVPALEAPKPSTFSSTINELSTDIILKSRQISMLIDLLPGIGVSPESQLNIIQGLTQELEAVEEQRLAKIADKDALLKWCEELIADVAGGIADTR